MNLLGISHAPRVAIAVIVLIAILLPVVSSAGESSDTGAETRTITLHPGDNFVGWVAEAVAVEDIFEDIPTASLIHTWNADARSYRYAVRGMDGTLETIRPGMAVKIRIDGRKAVQWERPLTPAKGLVTLYSGENWVAWNGRDEWPLDEVARGIGTSLVSIEVEDRGLVYAPDSSISDIVAPLEGDSTIRRGDALRVTVNRDLRWLQPTGMMPNIEWVGEISEPVREEITADMQRILDFFAEEFAIEPDFAETTLLLFGSIDAAVQHAESGAEPRFLYPPDRLRSTLETGWQAEAQPWGFFAWICGWQSQPPPLCHGNKAATLAHELFHVLQDQLSTRHPHLSPTWMSEGTATWLNWRLPPEFGQASYEDQRQSTIDRVAQTSEPLWAGENGFYYWVYDLGSVVADRLVERSGVDALLDFDRLLYPQSIGEERRWVQMPTWHEAFEAAFGLTVAAFYDEFEAWRATLPEPAHQKGNNQNDIELSGTLRLSDGTPALGFIAFAQEYDGEIPIGLERTAVVEELGAFTLYPAAKTIQRLRFTRDNCTLWLTNDGLSTARPQPGQYRDLDTRNLAELNLTLPEGACENQLSVGVLRMRGDERQVHVWIENDEHGVWLSPDAIGTYRFFSPSVGSYRMFVRVGGCDLWYGPNRLVAMWDDGESIKIGEAKAAIEVRVPLDLCMSRISGRLVKQDGVAVTGVWLTANGYEGRGGAHPDADGTFTITVPQAGEYSLSFWSDGCHVIHTDSGATSDWRESTMIAVADSDVTGIEFVVPADPSSLCR